MTIEQQYARKRADAVKMVWWREGVVWFSRRSTVVWGPR